MHGIIHPVLGFTIFETDTSGYTNDSRSTFHKVVIRLFEGWSVHTSTEEPKKVVFIGRTGRSSMFDAEKLMPGQIGRLRFTASLASTVSAAIRQTKHLILLSDP